MSKVSAIIPTYNRAAKVRAAIDSALAQEGAEIEVVVIDDGSTDGTEAVLAGYGDRIVHLRGTHRGPGSARNIGIHASSGEFIAFLDSDDRWLPGKTAAQLPTFAGDPEIGLVYSDMHLMGENGRTGEKFSSWGDFYEGWIFKELLRANFIPASSVVMRRECVERIGPFPEAPEMIGADEYHIWLRTARLFKAARFPEPFVEYSAAGEDRLSADGKANKLLKLAAVLDDIERVCPLSMTERLLLRRSSAKKFYEAGRLASRGEPAAGRLAAAIRRNPFYLRAYLFLARELLRGSE